jgi:hypothetical protein
VHAIKKTAMRKISFVLAILLVQSSFAFAGETLSKDSMQFDAEDAIRYAQFVDFHRFGESWSAHPDTSGNVWVVQAERSYLSKKVIKNRDGQFYCDTENGCTVRTTRIILMDKRNGKILGRKRHTMIFSN